MGRLLIRWILLGVSVWAAAYLTQALGLGFKVDVHEAGDTLRFLIGVAVLAFLNATIGTVLKILTIPLNCATLGLASLAINALILWLTASLGLGFRLEGTDGEKFFAAFVGALLIGFISGVLGTFVKDKDEKEKEGD